MGANATTKNEQAGKQRGSIIARNSSSNSSALLGVASISNISNSLFTQFDASGIINSSKDSFNSTEVRIEDYNPDFIEESVSLVYSKGEDLYSDVSSQEDLPNQKGPQLKTLKIGNNGQPDIENSGPIENSGLTLPKDRGFGVSEDPQSFPGRYNTRENVTLGDYISNS